MRQPTPKVFSMVVLLSVLACNKAVGDQAGQRVVKPASPLESKLRLHVQMLAGIIGPRNLARPSKIHAARDYVQQQWESMGYRVKRERVEAADGMAENLYVELPGDSQSWLIVGAHYDSCEDTPGADDNASGVAALLELSRRFKGAKLAHPLRMIAFANEEPPYFQTDEMGSLVHAYACKEREEKLLGMIALEMLGCYRDEEGSQKYPLPALARIYPKQGNFLAFVTDLGSADFMRRPLAAFKKGGTLPVQAISAPRSMTGIGFSDHWSFWKLGYKAFMVTDTAFFRSPHYHETSDKPSTIDYPRFTKAVEGLGLVLADLLEPPDKK